MARFRLLRLALPLALAAACGSDPSPVLVHTIDIARLPASGVTVHGHDADGVAVDEAVTDSAGIARLAVPAGGSITTHDPDSATADNDRWYSVLGVEPGDEIGVQLQRGTVNAVEARVTAPPLPSGATAFFASTACSQILGNSVATIRTRDDCPDRSSLVLTALDNTGTVFGYIVVTDVELVGDIAVAGPWVTPSQRFTVDASGFPPTGGSVRVSRGSLLDGYAVYWWGVSVVATTTTGTASEFHPVIGDSAVYEASQLIDERCDVGFRTLIRSDESAISRFTFSLDEMMPAITDVAVANHQLSWRGGGGGVGIVAGLEATAGSGASTQKRSWYVIAPPGTTNIHFPDDVDFPWPSGGASNDQLTAAYVDEVSPTLWATSYAEYRQHQSDPQRPFARAETTTSVSRYHRYSIDGCPPAP